MSPSASAQLLLVPVLILAAGSAAAGAPGLRFEVSFPADLSSMPLDGRVLLMIATSDDPEPRFRINDGPDTQQVFGIDVESLPGIAGPLDVKLDTMLLEGVLDAVIEPNVLPSISRRDPRVRRLFPDYRTEEQDYWKRTGIFPISHVVSLTQEFVDRHPEAPVALLKAYRQARDVAFDRLYGTDPEILAISWVASFIDDQRALMGDDYWAYNIQGNVRALEAMMLFAYQMGATTTQLDYTSFFDPDAAALPGS